jgi:MtrB/PioB family decaheme-associated outer membrane protein
MMYYEFKTPFRLAAPVAAVIIGALLLPVKPAMAQVDTSEWTCQYCPFPDGYRAEYSAGTTYVSDDAHRYGNGTGYDESGAYLNLDGSGRYRAENYQFDWQVADLGLDSRSIAVRGGQQGRFGFHLDYDEIPYRLFDSTRTVFRPTSSGGLSLPDGWIADSQTSGFSQLTSSLRQQNIESDRRIIGIGGEFIAGAGFSFHADYRNIARDGVDIVSGANFIQGSLLPRFFDFETDLVDLGIQYANGPLNLSAAWFGSYFSNSANSLQWENPFAAFPGAETGTTALEPDNEFQQISLSGTYRFDALSSVLAFAVATGQAKQNDLLLPYTSNPLIDAGELPVSVLDGRVDTSNYSLTLTSRPFPKARVRVGYRYDERDNRTPQSVWSRVVVDSFASGDSETNTPYSFDRTKLTASGNYRLLDWLRLAAGYERTELDRDFQEVAEQTEDESWVRVRMRLANWLDLSAKGGTSLREVDRYDTDVAISLGQNPLLRKYYLAHRYREFAEFGASITPAEKPFSIGLSALWADDDYSRSRLGLTGSETLHVSADVDYTLSEKTSIYLSGGFEDIDATQLGSATFSTPTWSAIHKDSFQHVGAGVRLRQLSEKIDLTLDYLHTDGTTRIGMPQSQSGNSFPELQSTLESIRLNMAYRRSERMTIDAVLRYESFESSDWALAGVEPDTIETVLSLGAQPYDYEVWVIGIGFRYLVGEM